MGIKMEIPLLLVAHGLKHCSMFWNDNFDCSFIVDLSHVHQPPFGQPTRSFGTVEACTEVDDKKSWTSPVSTLAVFWGEDPKRREGVGVLTLSIDRL